MQLGLIGLGKMGANMNLRLLQGGHQMVVWNRSEGPRQAAAEAGAVAAATVEELVSKLSAPRAVWVMVPAGDVTENQIKQLMTLLQPGDIIIDGGNSNYKDTIRNAAMVEAGGLDFVDVGTSGGIWGLEGSHSMMVGGQKGNRGSPPPDLRDARGLTEPRLGAYDHYCGYLVKMVHNGIEYGMMQAYAEGFEIFRSKSEMVRSYQILKSGASAASCARGCST
ncbi:MAG: NAD(P)-binding domain-containing protein [Anaerolineae bacterium]